ncbi:hypothetical protein K8R78_04690, partial [bacterium]|nr:hypothetical protein [bacterium]
MFKDGYGKRPALTSLFFYHQAGWGFGLNPPLLNPSAAGGTGGAGVMRNADHPQSAGDQPTH